MQSPKTGFAVIYRWRIREGHEDRFRRAWAQITDAFLEKREALGSRLYLAEDGTWVAHAQWPDKQAWERSRELGTPSEEASAEMTAAVEEGFEPILLHPVEDRLVGEG